MAKKVKATTEKLEECISREAKIYDFTGKPHDHLENNKDEPIDTELFWSEAGQAILFATKLGPKLGNATRPLSRFMVSLGKTH